MIKLSYAVSGGAADAQFQYPVSTGTGTGTRTVCAAAGYGKPGSEVWAARARGLWPGAVAGWAGEATWVPQAEAVAIREFGECLPELAPVLESLAGALD
jgi:hypothetical protein